MTITNEIFINVEGKMVKYILEQPGIIEPKRNSFVTY